MFVVMLLSTFSYYTQHYIYISLFDTQSQESHPATGMTLNLTQTLIQQWKAIMVVNLRNNKKVCLQITLLMFASFQFYSYI